MPKKKSPKASIFMKDGSDCQKETPSSNSKKGDEIDDIFASRKRKMAKQEKAEGTSARNEKLKKKKKKKRNPEESKAFNPDAKPRRRTNDGLTIYSEEELGINRQDAGSTGLCPFDCSCCF